MRGVEQIPWLYEVVCSLYEWGGLAEWRRWLVAGARGRGLDLGSGTGRNLPLLPRGTKAVAVDPSLDALERARRRAADVPVVGARAEALPFRDRSFDTVLSGLVFFSVAGGCHPNRDTEAAAERAGFEIQAEGRRAKGLNRRFAARITRDPEGGRA